MPRTRSGLSSYSCARLRMPATSSTMRSISGFLHSRQPMPAVRQPCCRPRLRLLARVDLVQVPDRAFVRIARVRAPHARRVGLHGLELLRDLARIFAQADGVAVGLRHLAAVEARHLRRRRQQRLRLGQDRCARAFEVAEQALAIGRASGAELPSSSACARSSASASPLFLVAFCAVRDRARCLRPPRFLMAARPSASKSGSRPKSN